LIVVVGMLYIAVTSASIVHNGLVMSRAHINSTKAYFAAESGTENILWYIRKSDTIAPIEAVNPFDNPSDWKIPGDPPSHPEPYCIRFRSPAYTDIDDTNTGKANCDAGASTKTLSNEATLQIEWSGTDVSNPVTFRTTGDYLDLTKRGVEVKYQF